MQFCCITSGTRSGPFLTYFGNNDVYYYMNTAICITHFHTIYASCCREALLVGSRFEDLTDIHYFLCYYYTNLDFIRFN
jgi:hypothetical protein